jgi:hypothetical protein
MIYLNRIEIVIIYKNFFNNFFKSLINRKELEPEPQFVILAPAPGGNLIWALGSGFRSTA